MKRVGHHSSPKGRIKGCLHALRTSRFFLAVYSVVGGSFIAQVLNLAFQPIVSRLYSVEQFGEYTVYTTVLSVGYILITLAYDQAVIAAKDRTEAQRLLFGTVYLSAILSALFALFCILCRTQVLAWMKLDDCDWLLLLPLNMFLLSCYNMVSSYNCILEKYRSIGVAACIRSGVMGLGQIALFYIGAGTSGLPLGRILALIACSCALVHHFLSSGISLENTRLRAVLSAMKENYQFPLFQMPASFVSNFMDMIITFSILALYSQAELGLYSRVAQTLSVPMSLIASSLRQVSILEFGKIQDDAAATNTFLNKFCFGSSILIILPMTVLFFFGEALFVFVFGKNWVGIGPYISLLVPLYSANFVSYAMSGAAVFKKKQSTLLLFQIWMMVTTFAVYLLSKLYRISIFSFLFFFSISLSAIYIVQIITLYRMVHINRED